MYTNDCTIQLYANSGERDRAQVGGTSEAEGQADSLLIGEPYVGLKYRTLGS